MSSIDELPILTNTKFVPYGNDPKGLIQQYTKVPSVIADLINDFMKNIPFIEYSSCRLWNCDCDDHYHGHDCKILTSGSRSYDLLDGTCEIRCVNSERKDVGVRCIYRLGKLHGPHEERDKYHLTKCYFKDGELDGIYKKFYYGSAYRSIIKCTYKNGKLQGEYIDIDIFGRYMKSFFYENGVLNGPHKIYMDFNNHDYDYGTNFDGEHVFNEDEFFDRIYIHQKIIKNGFLQSECTYVNGKYEGSNKIYYPNGNVKSNYNYVKGVLQGKAYLYFESGKCKETLKYKDGVRIDHKCIVM